jgi:hypothetical protein
LIEQPARILTSYIYLKDNKDLLRTLDKYGNAVSVYLDSGAFTAFTRGAKIDLAEYIKWLKSPPIAIDRFFQLDVIGEPGQTKRNLSAMRDAGLNPVPVFTRGTNFDELGRMYSGSDLVAVGGLVQTPNHLGYIKRLMREIGCRKIHWLGVTKPNFISKYQPYSCDSSSWVQARKFGRIQLYMGKGRFSVYTKKDAIDARPTSQQVSAIRSYGFTTNDLRPENWVGASHPAFIVGRRSFVRYAVEVAEKFGTKIYAAVTVSREVAEIAADYEMEIQHAGGVI